MNRILITGVNGFMGSRCYEHFSRGNIIYGIDRNPCGRAGCRQGLVTYENLRSFGTEFDCIIHLAGSGTVGEVYGSPEEEFHKSVSSTEELLEFVNRKSPMARVIYASSAAVYGDGHPGGIKEGCGRRPCSLYGEHKAAAEDLVEADSMKNGRNNVVLRFFSVYGEGLRKQVLWDTSCRIQSSMDSPEIRCFGTGREMRDFIHIDDALRMIELCVQDRGVRGIYNCGTGAPTTISHAVHGLGVRLGYGGKFIFEDASRRGNPESLVADMTKARSLGFEPRVDFEAGLERYTEWVRTLRG